MGQLGSLISVGFLRLGHPVFPLLRGAQPADLAGNLEPELVLAAVGEEALPGVLQSLPTAWKGRVALLSNELLPRTWQAYEIQSPTVISVQFEKKAGRPVVIDRPSPVFGPKAAILIQALAELAIPAFQVDDLEAMTRHLVLKNLYILTLNLAGMATQVNAEQLLSRHRTLTQQVWAELFDVQQALTEIVLDRGTLEAQTMDYLALAPERGAGRSAPKRLARILEQAEAFGIQTPTLKTIKQEAAT